MNKLVSMSISRLKHTNSHSQSYFIADVEIVGQITSFRRRRLSKETQQIFRTIGSRCILRGSWWGLLKTDNQKK